MKFRNSWMLLKNNNPQSLEKNNKFSMMKKIFLLIPVITLGIRTMACPACEAQQPKILRGIVHGAGPTSNWDYVAGIVTLIIVIAVLFYSIKWIINPGEKETTHIKRNVLNF